MVILHRANAPYFSKDFRNLTTQGKEKGQSIAIGRFWADQTNLSPQCFADTKLILSANSLPRVTKEG
jgi:hypothetical protein